jgi:phosphoribosylanthranilate isomerase
VLLDAYSPTAYGGTGERLAWPALATRGDALLGLPLVLAGGLKPDNVAEAITAARPDAVDVASGVESAPGVKDAAKVMAFVSYAKQALARLGNRV